MLRDIQNELVCEQIQYLASIGKAYSSVLKVRCRLWSAIYWKHCVASDKPYPTLVINLPIR
jgi:hypothetical protein